MSDLYSELSRLNLDGLKHSRQSQGIWATKTKVSINWIFHSIEPTSPNNQCIVLFTYLFEQIIMRFGSGDLNRDRATESHMEADPTEQIRYNRDWATKRHMMQSRAEIWADRVSIDHKGFERLEGCHISNSDERRPLRGWNWSATLAVSNRPNIPH